MTKKVNAPPVILLVEEDRKKKIQDAFAVLQDVVKNLSPTLSTLVNLEKSEYKEDEQCLAFGSSPEFNLYYYVKPEGCKKRVYPEFEYSITVFVSTYSYEDGPSCDEVDLVNAANPYALVRSFLIALATEEINNAVTASAEYAEHLENKRMEELTHGA
jgi:hypothetical protein